MKKLLLILFIALSFSCSSDDEDFDCEARTQEITEQYQTQIDWVYENTSPVDFNQIALIRAERDQKISEACN